MITGILNTLVQADTSAFDAGMAKAGKSAASLRSTVDAQSAGIKKAMNGLGDLSGVQNAFGGITGRITSMFNTAKSTITGFMSAIGPVAGVAIGAFAALGAATIGAGIALGVMASRGAEAIKELSKISRELGITTEAMAGLERFAGGGSGFEHFMMHLQRSVEDVSPKVEQAFSRMGLSASQFQGPDQDWVANLRLIADGYQNISSQAERMQVLRAIGGRGGIAAADDLARGSAGIDAMQARAERFGLTFSASQAESLRTAQREWDGFGMAIQGVGRQAAVMFAPAWEMIGKVGSAIGEWIVGAFRQAQPYLEKFGAFFTSSMGDIWDSIVNIGKSLGDIFIASLPLIEQMFEMIVASGKMMWEVFFGLNTAIFGDADAMGSFTDVVKGIIPWVKIIFEVFTAVFQAVSQVARVVWGVLWEGIKMIGSAIASAFGGMTSWLGDFFGDWGSVKDFVIGGLAVIVVALRNIGRTWDIVVAGMKIMFLEMIDKISYNLALMFRAAGNTSASDAILRNVTAPIRNAIEEARNAIAPAMKDFTRDVNAQIALWNFELGGGLLAAAAQAAAVIAQTLDPIAVGLLKAHSGHEAVTAGSEAAFSLLYGTRGNQDYYQKLTVDRLTDTRRLMQDMRDELRDAPAIRRARL